VLTDPAALLRADAAALRALDAVTAANAAPWLPDVLPSLLVLAIRRYDLESLASVLRCCAAVGRGDDPLTVRAAGYLRAQRPEPR
jgi:hypothetical protein